MFRRLPVMPLAFAAALGLFALTSTLTAQPPATPPAPAKGPDPAGVATKQEENRKLFIKFRDEVLRLAQRWESSTDPMDRDRAKSLRGVLTLIEQKGVEKLFVDLIEGIGSKSLSPDFNALIGKDKLLVQALEDILTILDTENESDLLKKEIKKLEDQIKAIKDLKLKQEQLRGQTENGKTDPNRLAKEQNALAKATQNVADALAKNNNANGNPNGGKEEPKSEVKTPAKPGDNSAQNKPDTNENKADTKADGMGGMNPMGNPMAAGDKPGAPMGGMAGGDKPAPMGGMMNPMGAGDAKPGPMDGGMNPPMGNPMSPPMGGDGKPQGAGKGDGKPSAGMPGGEAKGMGGEGMGGMGMPGMGGGMPGGSKGSGQPGGQQPPKAGQNPAQENVQGAVPNQQDAEDNIKKGDRDQASKKQDDAIRKFEQALEELEKLLKQLREKELAKLLDNLQERVKRMLEMQKGVHQATIGLNNTIKSLGGKPGDAQRQKSQGEADKEGAIVAEAEKALKLLEGEGTAVVFAGVLGQVKGDMEAIQKRLLETRVGEDTQQIEQDVIDQLTLMLEALKKAKQDLENKPSDSKPGDPNAKKQDNKLLELVNELKLIKALQEQVNKRTVMYNKQDPGEQAKDPLVQGELKQLAEKQKVLEDMLHKLATGANQ